MPVQVKINGIKMSAEPQETVLQVARRSGVHIPTLCHLESVESTGACRVCLVEMKLGGKTQLTTSCNAGVEDGMEIMTDTPEVQKHRAANLEMMLGRAPGSQKIRALAREYGVYESAYVPSEDPAIPGCILCELCVRVCEALGHSALAAVSRGGKKYIGTPHDKPSESCVGCGACAEKCPTRCIEMTDTKKTRTIWGQTFDFVSCETCGAPVMTVRQRTHAVETKELPEDYYTTCVACKQKNLAGRFARVGS